MEKQPKGKFEKFPSLSIRKSHKRVEEGLCIGCGKKPCVCKPKNRRKPWPSR